MQRSAHLLVLARSQNRRAAAIAVVLGLCAALIALPVQAQDRAPTMRSPFGVTGRADAALLAELGAGWSAVTFSWPRFYPADLSGWNPLSGELPARRFVPDPRLIETVQSESAAGREVVAVLRDTPPWASTEGDPAAVPSGLALPLDDPGNFWATFVRDVVGAFAPLGVRHWVIYETPDVGRGEGPVHFAGSVMEYAHMLRVASLAARAVDPAATIMIGALVGWVDRAAGRLPYLARLVEALRADPEAQAHAYYFDGVIVRALDSTALIWEQLEAARGILGAAGLRDKAIWLEAGAAPTLDAQDRAPRSPLEITPEQQADFIVQALVAGLANGAQRVAIFGALDADRAPGYALVRADGTRRPAFGAAQAVMALLRDVQAVEVYRHRAADLVLFDTEAQTIAVVWAGTPLPVSVTITAPESGEKAEVRTASAEARDVSAGNAAWPAAFEVSAPGAALDARGFLTVAGSPQMVVMPRRDDFYRVVYLTVGREQVRLR